MSIVDSMHGQLISHALENLACLPECPAHDMEPAPCGPAEAMSEQKHHCIKCGGIMDQFDRMAYELRTS